MTSNAVRVTKEIFKYLSKGQSFDRILEKVSVVEGTGNGRCVCEMTVGEEHENRQGSLHGGMIATLVDMVSTAALMNSERAAPGVSVDMNITYMKGTNTGDTIVIDANTLRLGRTMAFLTVDIHNKETGKLLAQGRHTKHLGEPTS